MRICLAVIALVALGVLAGALVAGFRAGRNPAASPAPARPASARPKLPGPRPSPAAVPVAAGYSFGTLNNPGDATFNELLGINNRGHIAGYFGSGASGHPNTGYILRPPYHKAKYQKIMFPGSAQTRLTGLNNTGVQVGSGPRAAARAAAPAGTCAAAGSSRSRSRPPTTRGRPAASCSA